MIDDRNPIHFQDVFWSRTSVVIMGGVSIGGGLLVLLLPDTTDYELPQTLEDGEQFCKHHQYKFVFPR